MGTDHQGLRSVVRPDKRPAASVIALVIAGFLALAVLAAPLGVTAFASTPERPAAAWLDPCPPEPVVRSAAEISCVIVPDVKGLTAERALAALTEAGLSGVFAEPPLAVGVVSSQNPAPGDSVTPDSIIELETVPVFDPNNDLLIVRDVLGKTLEDARGIVGEDLLSSQPVPSRTS